MASYTPTDWLDEVLSDDERYNILTDAGAPLYEDVQINLATAVAQAGTPVDASKMNKLEEAMVDLIADYNLNVLSNDASFRDYTFGAETTLNLTDSDKPGQILHVGSTDRTINFPEETSSSHPFVIANLGGTVSILCASTFQIRLAPGEVRLFIPSGTYDGYFPVGRPDVCNKVQAITTSDLAAVRNIRYLLDLSGLTADRNITLPAGALEGDKVELIVTSNDVNYSAIIKGATGVSINGLEATEWGRLRYKNEHLTFVYSGTNSWYLSIDGRANPRLIQVSASATPAIDVSMGNLFEISGIGEAITSMTSGLTSTGGPVRDGQRMVIRISDDGTPRAITWGASYSSTNQAQLPTLTIAGKWVLIELEYNYWLSAWMCVSVRNETSDETKRVWRSELTGAITGKLLITNTAYWVYVGLTKVPMTPKHIEFYLVTVGAGAQTAEVGLFSSPTGPNKGALVLTKIEATGTVDNLVTPVGVKRNTNAFSTVVPAGTHLWAGIRTAMATTQPTIAGLINDFAEGHILTTATPGALTGAGPFTGAIVAATVTVNHPDLRVVLD